VNYAAIKWADVANGPGVRVSLFVSGCTHHCPGCFNEEAQDFHYGQPFTQAEEDKILQALAPAHIKGLSLLGGEPFEPDNQGAVLELVERVRREIERTLKVGCTACGYCMPCPHGVDIPTAFRCYNQTALHKKFSSMLEYIQITSLKKDASSMNNCTKCGACEKHCPQHIEIRKELQNAKKALQPFYVRVALKLVNKLVKR